MLCITYFSGLEILLIQSCSSQISLFVDPWQLQFILIKYVKGQPKRLSALACYFIRNLFLSFLLRHFMMVHFQHRLLTSSKSLFFDLKVKCPFFHFLDLNGRLYLKRPKFTLFLDFFTLNPLHNFGIPVQIYESIMQFG